MSIIFTMVLSNYLVYYFVSVLVIVNSVVIDNLIELARQMLQNIFLTQLLYHVCSHSASVSLE